MHRLIFRNDQSPGDVVMLAAAVRDLHRCFPGRFLTDVRTPCPQLWENNPFVTPFQDDDPQVEVIQCHYPLIHQSNQAPYHFLHGFVQFLNERLGLNIRPTAFKGDIHLSKEEMEGPSPLEELGRATLPRSRDPSDPHLPPTHSPPSEGAEREKSIGSAGALPYPIWLICAGGKRDFTIKWWDGARYQAVVDHFRGCIQFVQVGAAADHHFDLRGVIDLRGRTDLRELIRLVYHCDGVVCPVTLLMHLAAAVPVKEVRGARGEVRTALRPCVVIAGGREPVHWEEYPGHQFIHTIGALPCCATGGCWRSRTLPLGDGDEKDRPENLCVDVAGSLPRCMEMITAGDVIRRIEMYLTTGSNRREEAHSERGRRIVECGTRQSLGPSAATAEVRPHPQPLSHRMGEGSQEREPLTVQNACVKAEEFIKSVPDYPGGFAGRGVVICGGGRKYFPCAWVCIQMLRRLGCTLPIQLWHLGAEEMDKEMKELVRPFGVECVDGWEVAIGRACAVSPLTPALSPLRGEGETAACLRGWELKPFAIIHCPFKEVLFLDADNVPVVNPEFLFDTVQFAMTGAIFWPDYRRLGPWRSIWKICGVPFQDEPEFESGQIVVDKERCWKALCLTMWYNEHSDFFYQHIHGDKDTFHLAFRKLEQFYTMPTRPIESLENVVMCQHDFDGRRIFQHRNLDKWRLLRPNRRIKGFLFEEECRNYLEDLAQKWSPHKVVKPANQSPAQRLAQEELIGVTWCYRRIGHDLRRMTFLRDGRVGTGAADGEVFWNVKEEKGKEMLLEIHSESGVTCRLHRDAPGPWLGHWLIKERMAVELKPVTGRKWTITGVMISCRERAEMRERTLRHLAATDWGNTAVHVEIDPARQESREMRQTRTSLLALKRALEWNTDYVLFMEDDLEFNRHFLHNLHSWLPLQTQQVTLAGLYNPNLSVLENGAEANCVMVAPDRIYGSQCFLLSKATVGYCVEHWEALKGMQDIRISRLAAQMGSPIYYHSPSLVQHVGVNSVWGGHFHQAPDFEENWRCEVS